MSHIAPAMPMPRPLPPQIITVRCASLADADLEMWLVGEKNGITGKVPSAYVEVLED